LSIHLCHKYSCRKLKEIGSHFGISESGVTQASRRVASEISKDRRLRIKVKKIENKLKMSKV
jgi:chromosomal replication initiation ATPase DnaA